MFQRSRELALEAQQKRREQARDAALQDKAQLGAVTRQAAGSEIDVGILHAFLEGASWADAFDSYFIGFCPEFAGFVVGQEYTLQQTDIHINFVKTAERLLDKQLGAMSIAPDQFLQQCLADIKTAPPGSAAARAAQAVMERLEECADFERFGAMMRRRYERIQAAGGSVEDDDDLPSQPEPQTETHAELSSEEAALMREQEHIRAARERRKRAREEAVARAAAAAEEIDVLDAQPEPEPEPEPEQEPQPSATSTTGALDSWEDGSDFAPPPKWEVGTVHRGVVSFWENMPGVGGYGMILKMGKPEIYVHNTSLPMDARRRWLRRGEQVEFEVGLMSHSPHAGADTPQAIKVVGVGPAGESPAPLLCQQMKGFSLKIAIDPGTNRFKLAIKREEAETDGEKADGDTRG